LIYEYLLIFPSFLLRTKLSNALSSLPFFGDFLGDLGDFSRFGLGLYYSFFPPFFGDFGDSFFC